MNRQKIVEIIPQLNSGGAERFVVDLCNELIKLHNVTLIVLFPLESNGFYKSELNPKINIISLNKKKGFDYLSFWKLFKIINKEKAQIVHTHLNSVFYSLPAILKPRSQTKFFHTLHNDAYKEAPGKKGAFIKKILFKHGFIQPITISKNSHNSFQKLYNISAPIIENGRSIQDNYSDANFCKKLEIYKNSSDTRVLLNVGRIVPQKNQLMLINSVDQLIKDGFDAVLLIIGAELDEKVLSKIKDLNSKSTYILGERTNVIDYLKASDAFCLSSLHEGMPISLIEAFATGAISISTPAGGVVNMIDDGVNGFISEDFSEEAYVRTLKRFFNLDEAEKKEMRKNSKLNFGNYSIERVSEQYLKEFYAAKC